jgi:uncharacterized protein (TIGR02453 family)
MPSTGKGATMSAKRAAKAAQERAVSTGVFGPETFRFFKDLGKNNKKVWMDKNRERYQETVVKPFRRLLEELAPSVLEIDDRFDTTGRNLSRINRDIRFAKDKTLYHTHMYVKFSQPLPNGHETGQLYVGVSAEGVTVGFRDYATSKRKESTLARIAEPRVQADPKWIAAQKKQLGRKYDSYWYTTVKGEWTKNDGWPLEPEHWTKIQGWIVRKKLKAADAAKTRFAADVAKVFKELYPLLKFTGLE